MSDIEPVIQVLSQSTLYGTGAVMTVQREIITAEISYGTVNEEYVIQKIIQDHEEKKKQEAALWKLGGAIVGGFLGLRDGFQVIDLVTTAASSAIAGNIASEIQKLDEKKLKELGLEWVNSPQSYIYHKKRHRGDAVRRILLVIPHPETNQPCTAFAAQFPDGYIAILSLIQNFDSPMFAVSGIGFDTDWVERKVNLGALPTDCGVKLPVEFWHNDNGTSMVAIPYRIPHHSMY